MKFSDLRKLWEDEENKLEQAARKSIRIAELNKQAHRKVVEPFFDEYNTVMVKLLQELHRSLPPYYKKHVQGIWKDRERSLWRYSTIFNGYTFIFEITPEVITTSSNTDKYQDVILESYHLSGKVNLIAFWKCFDESGSDTKKETISSTTYSEIEDHIVKMVINR